MENFRYPRLPTRIVGRFGLNHLKRFDVGTTRTYKAVYFGIRRQTFSCHYEATTLATMRRWADDDSPHVAPLGIGRLQEQAPVACHLVSFREDPRKPVSIIEALKTTQLATSKDQWQITWPMSSRTIRNTACL